MQYGIQLYSIRDEMANDRLGALRKIAAQGYANVEFAGGEFDELSEQVAEQVRDTLQDCGMAASGMHTLVPVLENSLEKAVAVLKRLGSDLLILAWSNPQTAAEAAQLTKALNGWQKQLAAQGIRLGYHTHAQEYRPIEGGRRMIDYLLEDTQLLMEIDTYWAYVAGEDPLGWMEQIHRMNRLPVIHIKDGLKDGTGKPLGKGTAPVAAVWAKANELGVRMVVESETQDPSGLAESQICMETLRSLEARKEELL